MKKLLALCLSVFLVIGLMPVSFAVESVEVSATETTYFEAEDYLTYTATYTNGSSETVDITTLDGVTVKSDGAKHASKYLEVWTLKTVEDKTLASLSVQIPFTVAASGPHSIDLSALSVTTGSGLLNVADIKLNGEVIAAISRHNSNWLTTTAKANLTAGVDNTLELYFTPSSAARFQFIWDYISIAAATVNPAGTYFEAEENTTMTFTGATQSATVNSWPGYINVINSGDCHGDKYVEIWANKVPNTDETLATVSIDIPFIASESGEYKIELHSTATSNYVHTGSKILLNGTQIAAVAASPQSSQTSDWWKTIVTTDLTAGESYTVTIVFGHPGSGYITAKWDYLYVEKTSDPVAVDVAASGTTRIEAEDYLVYTVDEDESGNNNILWAVGTDLGDLEGGTILSTRNGANGRGAYFDFDVDVASAGLYTLNTRMYALAQYTNYSISLNGEIPTAFYSVGAAGTSEWTTKGITLPLDEGINTIRFIANATNSGYSRMDIDYIDISPVVIDVSGTVPTTIEAEDYPETRCVHADGTEHTIMGEISEEILGATDGTCVVSNHDAQTDTTGKNSWNTEINVPTTGVYKIETVAGGYITGKNSGADITVDDQVIISDTVASAEEVLETITATAYLTAGKHTYSYIAKSCAASAEIILDYVKITPVLAGEEDALVTSATITPPAENIAGTTATVSYTFDSGKTEGDSILRVIYKDGTVWKVGMAATVSGGTGSIALPDSLVGKEVKIEFIPVDESGLMGALFVQALNDDSILLRALDITPTLEKSGDDFVATVAIQANSTTLGSLNVCLLVAQYDADGAMIAIAPAQNILVNVGFDNSLDPAEVVVDVESGATEARLFVWSGTGYADAGAAAYHNAVTCAN